MGISEQQRNYRRVVVQELHRVTQWFRRQNPVTEAAEQSAKEWELSDQLRREQLDSLMDAARQDAREREVWDEERLGRLRHIIEEGHWGDEHTR